MTPMAPEVSPMLNPERGRRAELHVPAALLRTLVALTAVVVMLVAALLSGTHGAPGDDGPSSGPPASITVLSLMQSSSPAA